MSPSHASSVSQMFTASISGNSDWSCLRRSNRPGSGAVVNILVGAKEDSGTVGAVPGAPPVPDGAEPPVSSLAALLREHRAAAGQRDARVAMAVVGIVVGVSPRPSAVKSERGKGTCSAKGGPLPEPPKLP